MASQNLNVGTAANANDGDTLRAAFIKVKKMFAEVYGQTYSEQGDLSGVTFEIKEDKLKATNSAVDGYVLTYDSASGGFTWEQKFDGDITGIVAGEGLTGSSLDSGDATLNVNVDDSTLEIDTDVVQVKDGGVDTDQLADDAVGYAKLGVEFTTRAAITSPNYDVDFETASIFTSTMGGDIDYDIVNPSVGDVKTLVLTGDGTDRTITFTMDGSTDTDANIFKKMKGSDDFVFTSGALNLVQMIVVDDTANGEEIWYSNSVVAS